MSSHEHFWEVYYNSTLVQPVELKIPELGFIHQEPNRWKRSGPSKNVDVLESRMGSDHLV